MVRFNDKELITTLTGDDIIPITDLSDTSEDRKVTVEKLAKYTIDNVTALSDGLSLSKNNFTDELKTKLDNVETGAEVNIIETINLDNSTLPVSNKSVSISLKTINNQQISGSGNIEIKSSPDLDEATINLNDNNELQAIGVVEKNENDIKYDWVGTYAEWLEQDIENEYPNWICYITDDNIVDDTILFNNPFSLFDCKFADHLLNNASWLRADTFEWNSGDVYVDAYNLLVEEFNNGYEEWIEGIGNCRRTPRGFKIFASWAEEEILNKYNTDGIAWFYILDTENKRFKLPRTKWGFKGLRNSVGTDIDEKLPNIKGQLNYLTSNGASPNSGNGALRWANATTSSKEATVSGTAAYDPTFDASRSSSAYQDNAPVQERGTQMYLYFYAGETVQNANLIDAGRIAEQLTTKVDVASSWGFPSSRHFDIGVGASGTQYTAPADGYVQVDGYGTTIGSSVTIYCNGLSSTFQSPYTGQLYTRGFIPVQKGAIFVLSYNAFVFEAFRFVYAERSN